MILATYDDRSCILGEGPLWHPEREQLFWFDILAQTLCSRTRAGSLTWQFDECVSAAGWIDRNTLLVASETTLSRFDIITGNSEKVIGLEEEFPSRRSNDGRADPWGGFWIGTMAKTPSTGEKGAIYRFFKGELRKLVPDVSISNSICFSPDQKYAYYSDTTHHIIYRQALDPKDGWPDRTAPEALLDFTEAAFNPDGAVVDSMGHIWVAMWGRSCVECYNVKGVRLHKIVLPALQVTCPAFGGKNFKTLFVTSASDGLKSGAGRNGQTFQFEGEVVGLPEYKVLL